MAAPPNGSSEHPIGLPMLPLQPARLEDVGISMALLHP
uniref:Uncharacterized protein n=1 Tax=Arundo donax TaxID=35708 RepID=A0A0A9C129_ARUDO